MTSLERLADIVLREGAMVALCRGSMDGTVKISMLKEAFDGPLVGPLLKTSKQISLINPVSGMSTDTQIMYAVEKCMWELGMVEKEDEEEEVQE